MAAGKDRQFSATDMGAGRKGVKTVEGFDGVKVIPPGVGRCPVCAAKHVQTAPHDRSSLYYQIRFYRKHRRFPSWEDAMAHLSPGMQAIWRTKLRKAGTEPEARREDGRRLD